MEGVRVMKRIVLVISILIAVLVPASLIAGDQFVANKAVPQKDGTIMVPLEVTNTQALAALDIPLQYSEGAVLDRVEFTDRVKSFQFAYANKDVEKRQVVIGLISMMQSEAPDLAVGSGAVANLYFKVDPGVTDIEVKSVELQSPDHSLTYYYNDYSSGQAEVKTIQPEMVMMNIPVSGKQIPTSYSLNQNSPNPFNPVTNIKFAIPASGEVKLEVYNVLGQQVRLLVNENMDAGYHEVIWDGKDTGGTQVASGIYFYRIKADNFSDTKKMVLLK